MLPRMQLLLLSGYRTIYKQMPDDHTGVICRHAIIHRYQTIFFYGLIVAVPVKPEMPAYFADKPDE